MKKRIINIIIIILVIIIGCKNSVKNIDEQNTILDDKNFTFENSNTKVVFTMKQIPAAANVILGDKNKDDNFEHTVSLSAYCIGETEVTQELWEAVMEENPSNFKDIPHMNEKVIKRPVENINWYDAVNFCNVLTKNILSVDECVYKINGNTVSADFTKKGFRLPTEAEWEYAAIGGKNNKYAGTNEDDALKDFAWYMVNSEQKTHQVKMKKSNGYGLYDMSGNVYEWCWDKYEAITTNKDLGLDPVCDSNTAVGRTLKGGSWEGKPQGCEHANRAFDDPAYKSNFFGLRLVCRP